MDTTIIYKCGTIRKLNTKMLTTDEARSILTTANQIEKIIMKADEMSAASMLFLSFEMCRRDFGLTCKEAAAAATKIRESMIEMQRTHLVKEDRERVLKVMTKSKHKDTSHPFSQFMQKSNLPQKKLYK